MSNHHQKKFESLLKLVQQLVQHDHDLREQFHTGDKFRFIRDRLQAVLTDVEQHVNAFQQQIERKKNPLQEHEAVVYVYLYNAQGVLPANWNKMVGKDVFYEYSVNRPIYTDKKAIEAYIRSKKNKFAHAYLTIAVKKTDILPSNGKDALNQEVFKVREGSLSLSNLVAFTHNDIDYIVDEFGNLKIKPADE